MSQGRYDTEEHKQVKILAIEHGTMVPKLIAEEVRKLGQAQVRQSDRARPLSETVRALACGYQYAPCLP